MKKLLFFLFLAGLSTSCNGDLDNSALPEPAVDPVSKYAVSAETALGNLKLALETIQGETRAGFAGRRVESIRPLDMKSLGSETRSVAADVDNLLYVVTFEDGNGSAVLGADTRVGSVYAILDETVLTPEDFVRHDTRSLEEGDAGDIRDFLTGVILDDAVYRVGNPDIADSGIDIGGGDGDPIRAPVYSTVIVDKVAQTPLLRTKWNQDSPYNDECDWNSTHTGRCPAGCSNIAVGQVLAYNQSGSTITIAGISYSWNLINECKYGSYPSAAAKSEIARFIHAIGVWMGTSYKDKKSSAPLANAPKMFRHVGYQGVSLIAYNESTARNLICSKKAPFYMYGANAANTEAHAWVIDGWNEYTKQSWVVTYNSRNLPNPRQLLSEEHVRLVHCNFGWGGKCDGYYRDYSFDTTRRLDSDDIDSSVGDYAGSNPLDSDDGYRYVRNFQMVDYAK